MAEEGGPGVRRQVDADVVDGCAGQRHADAHQGVDGVTEEGHHHQEDAAQAVNHREEQAELDRPGHVRTLEPQVDLAADGEADEEPVVEAEVVDQLEDVPHAQVDEGHAAVKQQRWDGGVALHVDHAENVRQVALSGPHEEQPGSGDDGGVEASVAGDGHGQGDQPAGPAQHLVRKRHSNGLAGQHSVRVHDDVISDVSQDVDHRDDGHGNGNG